MGVSYAVSAISCKTKDVLDYCADCRDSDLCMCYGGTKVLLQKPA